MATNIFRGDAPAVAQLNTVTPANVLIGNTFTLVINGKSITYTAAAATVADVTAGLVALINLSTIPEFHEVLAADITTALTLKAATPGMPIVQTSSAAGGTATLITATTTASSGPNDWSTPANWSLGLIPVTGDAVYLTQTASNILYGLTQSAVTLASLTADPTFTGTLGLPRFNPSGYYEYRSPYLVIGVTVGTYAPGSGRFKVDHGAIAYTVLIPTTGQSTDQGLPAVILKGTNAANVLNILQGSVGVAIEPGDVSTVLTIQIGYQNAQSTDVALALGAGCTLTTIQQNGGIIVYQSSVTTHRIQGGGTATVLGATNITTLDIEAGTVNYQGTGTIATATIGSNGAKLVFTQDPRARTITNLTLDAGATLLDPNKTVTFTNPLILQRCGLSQVTLDLGVNMNLQRS